MLENEAGSCLLVYPVRFSVLYLLACGFSRRFKISGNIDAGDFFKVDAVVGAEDCFERNLSDAEERL